MRHAFGEVKGGKNKKEFPQKIWSFQKDQSERV